MVLIGTYEWIMLNTFMLTILVLLFKNNMIWFVVNCIKIKLTWKEFVLIVFALQRTLVTHCFNRITKYVRDDWTEHLRHAGPAILLVTLRKKFWSYYILGILPPYLQNTTIIYNSFDFFCCALSFHRWIINIASYDKRKQILQLQDPVN